MPESKHLITLNGKYVSLAHTICASSAFIAALVVGVSLHYHKIIENAHYGYPDEWFPSVSATIGDRYPERSIFQILIALTSGPRFLLLLLSYIRLYDPKHPNFSKFGVVSGILRTVTCGGWVYITSTDDHDAHDVFMISYMVLSIPWEYYVTTSTPKRTSLRSLRFYTAISFYLTIVPLIYFFIQHKVHKIAGAYSVYSYFEWGLIIFDITFDAWTFYDFKDLEISVTASKSLNFTINKSGKAITAEKHDLKPKLKDDVSYFEIISNIINSFIYWSVATSLLAALWYFPLWNMGASGFEFSIITLSFAIFLIIPPLKKIVTSYPFLSRVFCTVFGIGAFLVEDQESRLFTIAVGVTFGSIALANEVSVGGYNTTRGKCYAATFTIGLLLSSIAKFANYSDNPVWSILHAENGGWNKTGVAVGLIGALLTRRRPTATVHTTEKKGSAVLIGIGLGSLLFSLHAMLVDSSTMITWVWDGYPIHGPLPVPHGAVTLITMMVGIYAGLSLDLSSYKKKIFIMGSVSATILYFFSGWIGYMGALGYTLFLTSIIPLIFNHAALHNPAVVFGTAGLIHVIYILAHVWVVAYAFVPYGWLLRERTDLVLGSSVGLIALALFQNDTSIKLNLKPVLKKIKRVLLFLTTISLVIAYLRFPKTDPQPNHPDSRIFTAGIWTIHFGLDNDMWTSQGLIGDLIRDLELDVVGLLETDTQRIVMGNRDLTQQLSEELNMYADYGPGPNKHTWGCILLSKFPILNSTHHLLPSPVGELAPAIHATLDIYGELVDVVVFHGGQEEDVEDRRLQALGIADIMGSSNRPLVLLSYLVTTPKEGNYNTYVSEHSGMHDVDPSDWDRWCQYILYKKLVRTGYARITRGTITDTEVQAAKFYVPKPDQDVHDNEYYSQSRIAEDDVAPDLRFPSIFYGDGIREHRFHVFDEPRYFTTHDNQETSEEEPK